MDHVCTFACVALTQVSFFAFPFPFVDLKRFSPQWAIAQVDAGRIMPFSVWAGSFQRWALAMECTSLATYTACQEHFDNCLRASEEARGAGKSALLGIVYDEVVRKRLADLAHAGLVGFKVNTALATFDANDVAAAELILNQKMGKQRYVSN